MSRDGLGHLRDRRRRLDGRGRGRDCPPRRRGLVLARLIELGRADYRDAWALQLQLVDEVAQGGENAVVLVEHDLVYTVGRRRGAADNVLDPGDVPVVEIERGGDVTWHGPGQLVAYPILRLEPVDLHAHLHRLEDAMMATCAAFGLPGERDPRNTGTWIRGRKVGSVGIACRKGVTFHGLALNVSPDLAWFARIHPCGFPSSVMTSFAEEGCAATLPEVWAVLRELVRGW